VKLWDLSDPEKPVLLATFSGHNSLISTVLFLPDGHTLATASNDQTVRLWETDVEAVAARVCEVAYPRITAQEWDQYFPGLPYTPPCPA
jgi:hypothetical protein